MRRRRYFVGLAALLVAASTLVIAAPASALTNACDNTMNPANNGNASGLTIACTFVDSASAGASLIIDDYKNAVWHAGNARLVTVTVTRLTAPDPEAGNYVLKHVGGAATEKGPSTADVNHSIENMASSKYDIQTTSPNAAFIDAGTTIRAVGSNFWVLSKPTVDGRNNAPLCPGNTDTTCSESKGIQLRISNTVGRDGNNGVTTDDSATVTSAQTQATGCSVTAARPGCTGIGTANTAATQGMHFCAPALGSECAVSDDRGNFISGGDLPDGAQISTVNSRNSVTLLCTAAASVGGAPAWNWGAGEACVSPFVGTVTADTGVLLTITPYPIPTSTRFVSGATFSGSKGGSPERTITMASPTFSNFDVGMQLRGCNTSTVAGSVCAVKTEIAGGTRIASVGAGGTTAVMDPVSGSGSTWTTGAGQHFTLGDFNKTAPATGGIVGSLAIALIVSPTISPTSPPCSANKVSGFQLPMKMRNPGPTNPYVFEDPGFGYDQGFAGPPVNHYIGASITGTSTAQFTIQTSVTTFGGYLRQNITVSGGVPTTTRWRIHFESLPVGIGLCTGTGIAETLEIKGLESKHALNPSGTGGSFGAVRALLPEPQAAAVDSVYTGTGGGALSGANVTAGAAITETNTCKVTAPNVIGIGCQP